MEGQWKTKAPEMRRSCVAAADYRWDENVETKCWIQCLGRCYSSLGGSDKGIQKIEIDELSYGQD